MRIPVFARGANPSSDRPILRKSKSYADEQVGCGRADYVDDRDPAKGIVCRELLYFGAPTFEPQPADFSNAFRPTGELRGVKFVPPVTDPRLAILAGLKAGWDWQFENAIAG
jgi:hypothetical protein